MTRVTPQSGSHAGGTTVTIRGVRFSGVTAVDFGAGAAAQITLNSDSSITAVSPAGRGTVDVTVTTPHGVSPDSADDQFSYH